ncbi:MAG: hypothetical protein RL215_2708 [Planctomycetota bacterium]|jgi:hypothetical protein
MMFFLCKVFVDRDLGDDVRGSFFPFIVLGNSTAYKLGMRWCFLFTEQASGLLVL